MTILSRAAEVSPARRREILRAVRKLQGEQSLFDFINEVTPHEPPPPHIAPIIELFERARTERIFALVSWPPRHAKTVTVLKGLAWWVRDLPGDTCAYTTYNDRQAKSKSRIAREYARRAGVLMADDSDNLNEWRTAHGGGLLAAGVDGGLTGQGIGGIAVVDDPFKNHADAQSALVRQNVRDWFNTVLYTRLEGGSVIVLHTRWHENDLIGELAKEEGWEVINIPAITDEGVALWPERFPIQELEQIRKRIGDFAFEALYQGRPRPRGDIMFGPPTFYDPKAPFDGTWGIFIGADTAASTKASADYSVAVALAARFNGQQVEGRLLEVMRGQWTVPEFARRLRTFQIKYKGALVGVESVSGFKAVPQIMREMDPGLRVIEIIPKGDKFQRALPASAAWNDGRLPIPEGAPWNGDFLNESNLFTGVNDEHDDQIDALSHAFNMAVDYFTKSQVKRGSVHSRAHLK